MAAASGIGKNVTYIIEYDKRAKMPIAEANAKQVSAISSIDTVTIKKEIDSTEMCQKNKWKNILTNVINLYIKHNSRSSKKVDYFHNFIKDELNAIILRKGISKRFRCELEKNIKSYNASGRKRCDIVIYKNELPFIVFPVKIIMSNYKQNKNNAWENLTGELMQMKWANEGLHLIPINILFNKTPYLQRGGSITKFEHITYDDIKIYNVLKEKNVVHSQINYIINVEHNCKIGDKYDKCPNILSFDDKTPFINITTLLSDLLCE